MTWAPAHPLPTCRYTQRSPCITTKQTHDWQQHLTAACALPEPLVCMCCAERCAQLAGTHSLQSLSACWCLSFLDDRCCTCSVVTGMLPVALRGLLAEELASLRAAADIGRGGRWNDTDGTAPSSATCSCGRGRGDCCMGVSLLLSAHRHGTLQAVYVCLADHAFVTPRGIAPLVSQASPPWLRVTLQLFPLCAPCYTRAITARDTATCSCSLAKARVSEVRTVWRPPLGSLASSASEHHSISRY